MLWGAGVDDLCSPVAGDARGRDNPRITGPAPQTSRVSLEIVYKLRQKIKRDIGGGSETRHVQ